MNVFTYLNRYQLSVQGVDLEPQTGSIYVSGAVQSPGIYNFTTKETVADLITRAGGFTPDADKEFINKELVLTKSVANETKLFIPFESESSSSLSVGSDVVGVVSINSASLSELDSLPGIGPATAQKIIDSRPFSSLDQLKDVPGIGDKKFGDLLPLISI